MTKQQLIIFDLDGTTVDTEFEVSRITADIANAKGCPITAEEVFRDFSGLGSRAKFEGIGKRYNKTFTEDELKDMSRLHKEGKDAIYDQAKVPLMKGVRRTIRRLSKKKFKLAVGSTNPAARSQVALKKTRLSRFFNERVYGPEMTATKLSKPAPDVFQLAMAENGATPDTTIVVEDTLPGVQAGHAAGAFVVAVLDARFGEGEAAQKKIQEFREAGADLILRDYSRFIDGIKLAEHISELKTGDASGFMKTVEKISRPRPKRRQP